MIQDVSHLIRPCRQHIDPTRVPYSNEALSADLRRLDAMWEEFQSRRDRKAIYLYLGPVLELAAVWEALGQIGEIASSALRLRDGNPQLARDPFGVLIFCTSDPEKVDRRTRSKWSRVLRYATRYKSHSKSLEMFVTKRGGINQCAERYSRRLGRHSKKQVTKRRITLADIIRAERIVSSTGAG
jgi:hypothetical protein